MVGLLAGNFRTAHPKRVISAIIDEFSGQNVDISVYMGTDTTEHIKSAAFLDRGFDYHNFSLYEYSMYHKMDVLVISCGTLSMSYDSIDMKTFLSLLPDVPKILLETTDKFGNCINITVDNKCGMKCCVDYLIETQHIQNPAFIAGPLGNFDASERLYAYRESLSSHGLIYRADRIIYGNYCDIVTDDIKLLLTKDPEIDAIICANDEMTKSAYRAAKSLGLEIGKDIFITGFDDDAYTAYMDPPLATVRQDYEEIAKTVVEKILGYFEGKPLSDSVLSTKFIPRASCGYKDNDYNLTLEAVLKESVALYTENTSIRRQQLTSALMLRSLLTETIDKRDFFQKLATNLKMLGANHAFILLLSEAAVLEKDETLIPPEPVRIYMSIHNEECIGYSDDDAPFLSFGELNEVLGDEESPLVTTNFILFCGNEQYGILSAEIDLDNILFYYTLSLEIGSAIRFLNLSMIRTESKKALEKENAILDYSASHDSLTGLFNRSGIMTHLTEFVQSHRYTDRYLAIVADLDHLKQINDNFGHAEGDFAINFAGRVLTNVLPDGSLIARTGGDEFMAFVHIIGDLSYEDIDRQIKQNCRVFNETSSKPYYAEISTGYEYFDAANVYSIKTILKEADKKLYKAKELRRKSIIK